MDDLNFKINANDISTKKYISDLKKYMKDNVLIEVRFLGSSIEPVINFV